MSLSFRLSMSEFLNSDFRAKCLSTWSSDSAEIWHTYQPLDVDYDADAGTDVNSYFLTSWSPKIRVRGILCKSLFSTMCWKYTGHEIWELKLFCNSKTDRVADFFFYWQNIWVGFLLTQKYYCSLENLWFHCSTHALAPAKQGRSFAQLRPWHLPSRAGVSTIFTWRLSVRACFCTCVRLYVHASVCHTL